MGAMQYGRDVTTDIMSSTCETLFVKAVWVDF